MIEKYGEENVLVLKKSLLFLFVKVIFPVFWWFIAVFCLRILIYINLWDYVTIKILFTIFMLLLYRFILTISSVVKYYIDYKMDFSVVTPEYLTRYNQTWFFKRDIKSSYVRNIKTITIIKNSIWYNIFNNWNLIFLSEWDREKWDWEIVLHYIQNPEDKKKEITRIMKIFNQI
jgi:hypothetical protein